MTSPTSLLRVNFMVRRLLLNACAFLSLLLLFPPSLPAETAPSPFVLRGSLANSSHRFTTEKTGHVAFLGGSITENTSGHTALIPAWLRERFPETAFTFTNAGLSSTCSHTGAFRLERDILSQGPVDLLFVEFAVNDDQDAGHSREQAICGMEGIIRHVRSVHPAADIVMLHFVNTGMLDLFARGETPVSVAAHEAVAERHGIPSVHVGAALAREIAAGRKTWDADYGGVHPNPTGYRFVADLVTSLLDQAWTSPGAVGPHPAAEPLDPGSFARGTFLDPQAAAWMGGWSYGPCGPELLPSGAIRRSFKGEPILVASEPGAALTVSFEGRDLGMFILAGPDAGTVESSVDGGPFQSRDLFHAHSKGLNYPRTVMLHQGLRPGFHQVTLRVADAKAESSTGHRIAILQFTVNR